MRAIVENMIPAQKNDSNYSNWVGLKLPEYIIGVRAIPEHVAMKCLILAKLGNHGWQYPKQLNAIWPGVSPKATISDEELEYIINPYDIQEVNYSDSEIEDDYDQLLNSDSECILEDMYYAF